MIKVLFFIHDLGQGGAEKVLVNLVNNMDKTKFEITVMALFAGGINESNLSKDVRYRTCFQRSFPGNSHFLKLFSPSFLHKIFIKDTYDIEVSYLEGVSARIISGCKDSGTKLVSWIHVEQHTMDCLAGSFRNSKEARECYGRFQQIICVSEYVKKDFIRILDYDQPCRVLYNTVESEKIRALSNEWTEFRNHSAFSLVSVGTLKKSKGHDRVIRILHALRQDHVDVELYILGDGPEKEKLKCLIEDLHETDHIHLLGYQSNPYKYVRACDLLVCASFSEGFSTAVTEALIVGTPVCTVEVSGMRELLGQQNEYGMVVENDDQKLYEAVKRLIEDRDLYRYYQEKASIRGRTFNTEQTVKSVEEFLLEL